MFWKDIKYEILLKLTVWSPARKCTKYASYKEIVNFCWVELQEGTRMIKGYMVFRRKMCENGENLNEKEFVLLFYFIKTPELNRIHNSLWILYVWSTEMSAVPPHYPSCMKDISVSQFK
jgi:hypothetical protein